MNSLVNISEGTSLAFHGLGLLARTAPGRVSVKQAARSLKASEAHLAKVFGKLRKRGWVSSVRGPSGGFTLRIPPEEISFLDVYELFEEAVDVKSCPLGGRFCPFGRCVFDSRMEHVIRDIYRIMKSTTISDLGLSVGSGFAGRTRGHASQLKEGEK